MMNLEAYLKFKKDYQEYCIARKDILIDIEEVSDKLLFMFQVLEQLRCLEEIPDYQEIFDYQEKLQFHYLCNVIIRKLSYFVDTLPQSFIEQPELYVSNTKGYYALHAEPHSSSAKTSQDRLQIQNGKDLQPKCRGKALTTNADPLPNARA